MYLLNFSHALTDTDYARIEELTGEKITMVRDIPVQIVHELPLEPQIIAIADSVGLTHEQWQSCPIVINPPAYSVAAVALIAQLHGRIGTFPTMVRMRPRQRLVTNFEVAEVINLHGLREAGRRKRFTQ